MTANDSTADSPRSGRETFDLPEHLPPVQPPSVGFIVQLFVVPAIIVAVVVGLYLLFTRMASGEADWRQLVSDIRSENPHVRWSSANQLATLLTDAAQKPADPAAGPSLSSNREIAQALVPSFTDLARKTTLTEEEQLQLEFLAKAVGQLDVPDLVIPALIEGAQAGSMTDFRHTLRKTALNSLAMVVGRARDHKRLSTLPPDLDSQLALISEDPDRLFRNQAAFVLGLSGGPAAIDRLKVMLEDPEPLVRANAAVGLARNASKAGLSVLEEILKDSSNWKMDPPGANESPEKAAEEDGVRFERIKMLGNALRAVGDLGPQLSDTERDRLTAEVQRISSSFPIVELRSVALKTAQALAPTK